MYLANLKIKEQLISDVKTVALKVLTPSITFLFTNLHNVIADIRYASKPHSLKCCLT